MPCHPNSEEHFRTFFFHRPCNRSVKTKVDLGLGKPLDIAPFWNTSFPHPSIFVPHFGFEIRSQGKPRTKIITKIFKLTLSRQMLAYSWFHPGTCTFLFDSTKSAHDWRRDIQFWVWSDHHQGFTNPRQTIWRARQESAKVAPPYWTLLLKPGRCFGKSKPHIRLSIA